MERDPRYKKTPRQPLRRCTCGMMTMMGEVAHSKTKSHLVAPAVTRALVQGRSVDLIHKDMNISIELVRRIGLSSGAYKNHRSCPVSLGETIPPEEASTSLLRRAAHFAAKAGYECRYARMSRRAVSLKRIFVNGHLCAVGKCCRIFRSGSDRKVLVRLAARTPLDYDFFLGETEVGWIVVPVRSMPRVITAATVSWGGGMHLYLGAHHLLGLVPERLMLTTPEG